jgi:hypothetical protein
MSEAAALGERLAGLLAHQAAESAAQMAAARTVDGQRWATLSARLAALERSLAQSRPNRRRLGSAVTDALAQTLPAMLRRNDRAAAQRRSGRSTQPQRGKGRSTP